MFLFLCFAAVAQEIKGAVAPSTDLGDTFNQCWSSDVGSVVLHPCRVDENVYPEKAIPTSCCEDLGDVDWTQLANSQLFHPEWQSWWSSLESLGNCEELPQPLGESLECFYDPTCTAISDVGMVLQLSKDRVEHVWQLCAPAGLLLLLITIEAVLLKAEKGCPAKSLVLGNASKALMQYFVMRVGWNLRNYTGTSTAAVFTAFLPKAESRAIGYFRFVASTCFRAPFSRCDVCCSHATCPHLEKQTQEESFSASAIEALCPQDRKFDAIQDMRDAIWARAKGVVLAATRNEAYALPQFTWCNNIEKRESDGLNAEEESLAMWDVSTSSSCIPQQIAEKFFCFVQQWHSHHVFTAARMLYQAGLLTLFCLGCSVTAWPLPFSIEDLWYNLHRAIHIAVAFHRFAKRNQAKRARAPDKLAVLLTLPPWQTPELSSAHALQHWSYVAEPGGSANCPLKLTNVCIDGGHLEATSHANITWNLAGIAVLQACHSAVGYHLHLRKQPFRSSKTGLISRSGGHENRKLIIIPLADLSFHITEAFRTWFGGALFLVHRELGGPGHVQVLIADTDEAQPFDGLPRPVRYGDNHGGQGVRYRLGFFDSLMKALSDLPVLWLSAIDSKLLPSNCYEEAIWGTHLPGMAHGRGFDYDCTGAYCFADFTRSNIVQLRQQLNFLIPSPSRERRRQVLIVQRPSSRPRHIAGVNAFAASWQRMLGKAIRVIVWRPEVVPVVEQLRRVASADVLAVVTGQACGLGALLRQGRVLLEFTPALDGPYCCRRGWDMNPTSEVGQIARLAEVHHFCLMISVDHATKTVSSKQAIFSDGTDETMDRLTWRTVPAVVLPTLASGLGRVLRQAIQLVRRCH